IAHYLGPDCEIRFGAGIRLSDLKFKQELENRDLWIAYGDRGDRIKFEYFTHLGAVKLKAIYLEDDVLSGKDLLDAIFKGDDSGNEFWGTTEAETMLGGGSRDWLHGLGGGQDYLYGDEGDDWLYVDDKYS